MKEIEEMINSLNKTGYDLELDDRGNQSNIFIKFDIAGGVLFSNPKDAMSALILLDEAKKS